MAIVSLDILQFAKHLLFYNNKIVINDQILGKFTAIDSYDKVSSLFYKFISFQILFRRQFLWNDSENFYNDQRYGLCRVTGAVLGERENRKMMNEWSSRRLGRSP